MAYTAMYMLATGPNSGVLPSIGSVAANSTKTEDTSFIDFQCSTPEAESIRATFGEVAYQQYVEGQLAAQKATSAKADKKPVAPAKRSKIQRWIAKIRQAYRESN